MDTPPSSFAPLCASIARADDRSHGGSRLTLAPPARTTVVRFKVSKIGWVMDRYTVPPRLQCRSGIVLAQAMGAKSVGTDVLCREKCRHQRSALSPPVSLLLLFTFCTRSTPSQHQMYPTIPCAATEQQTLFHMLHKILTKLIVDQIEADKRADCGCYADRDRRARQCRQSPRQ
jgi:hypothetical protein